MADYVVAMSGGVDSSVAAALLQKQGHNIMGITLQIWPEENDNPQQQGCCSVAAVDDARRVAQKLGIKFYVLNFREKFQEKVIDYFINEYIAGRTPNPCIMCNRKIKFGHLLDQARGMGADFLATGHYARIDRDESGRIRLLKGVDQEKDQSYALYNLHPEQLKLIDFPLGGLEKGKPRELAREFDLPVAAKGESQEICFVPDDDHGNFIANRQPEGVRPGKIVDENGKEVGGHKGLPYYTVGQRRGLGLAMGYPVYVKEIRAEENEIVVGPRESIYSRGLIARDLNWTTGQKPGESLSVEIKIRYNAPPVAGTIIPHQDRVEAIFSKPVPAVTPGQSAVFYQGEEVLGGGIIQSSLAVEE